MSDERLQAAGQCQPSDAAAAHTCCEMASFFFEVCMSAAQLQLLSWQRRFPHSLRCRDPIDLGVSKQAEQKRPAPVPMGQSSLMIEQSRIIAGIGERGGYILGR